MKLDNDDLKDIAKGLQSLAEIAGILEHVFRGETERLPQTVCYVKDEKVSAEAEERRRHNVRLSRAFMI